MPGDAEDAPVALSAAHRQNSSAADLRKPSPFVRPRRKSKDRRRAGRPTWAARPIFQRSRTYPFPSLLLKVTLRLGFCTDVSVTVASSDCPWPCTFAGSCTPPVQYAFRSPAACASFTPAAETDAL